MGSSSRDVHYDADAAEAFEAVVQAFTQVGKIDTASDRTKTVDGLVRSGLQRVRLRVSVLPSGRGSVIQVQGASDDVWGHGARKASDKLINALD